MKTSTSAFTRSYHLALRDHLKQGSNINEVDKARLLGQRAMNLGLGVHDLARIHEEALLRSVLPAGSARSKAADFRRSVAFFSSASAPIEEGRHRTRKATTHLNNTIGALTQRTRELASANKKLKQEITRKKAVEKSLRLSERTSTQLLKQSRRMQEELRLLSRRLLSVQEEERKRISRELHDVVAQTLTGINVRLAMLITETTASAKDLHKKIAMTQRLVQKSVEIVHRFARDLRPTVLDDLGLVPALQSYFKSFKDQTGLPVELAAFAGVEKLDGGAKTVLYRIVQESLANVVQHAQASRVRVLIAKRKGLVRMDVHDNGRGFDTQRVGSAEEGKHLGLLGMRERVEMIGGTFCVQSAPGKRTTIRVEVPHVDAGMKFHPVKKSGNASLECP